MYCSRLQLKDFRNYRKLDLALPSGLIIFEGENAAGKTSLLEAIYLLATTKSPRVSGDQELVNFESQPEYGAPAFARLAAKVQRAEDSFEAEIIITRDSEPDPENFAPAPTNRKRIKFNGQPKRALDLIGQLNVVLFSPEDLDLVIGSPSLRRRYLDITLSQIDRRYLRLLSAYEKVRMQRNGYLRNVRDRDERQGRGGRRFDNTELAVWNEELVKAGSYLIKRRYECLAALNDKAVALHANLTGLVGETSQDFALTYQPSFELAATDSETVISEQFNRQLDKIRERELASGTSLAGPHRDDFGFIVNGKNVAVYGSRGQQRTAVLALKLAETAFMYQQTEERPILLLDDILSELDVNRRQYVLETIQVGAEQVLITTADLSSFGQQEHLHSIASLYQVEGGRVIAHPKH